MTAWSAPWLLVLLVLVPVWVRWRARTLRADAVVLPALQHPVTAVAPGLGPMRGLLALEAAILTAVVLGLAGPERVEELEVFEEDGVDLALILDISASMHAADLEPSRLEVLKSLSKDLVRRRGGDRVAVYAFAAFALTQVPFSTDTRATIDLIDSLSYRSVDHSKAGGTAIGDALLIALDDLQRAALPDRDQVIVLATDGESQTGVDPVLAAQLVQERGVALHVIGIGKDETVPVFVEGRPFIVVGGKQLETHLDDAQLRQIAEAAGGTYRRADSTDVLAATFRDIDQLHRAPLRIEAQRTERSLVPGVALALSLLLAAWLALDAFRLRRPLR